MRTVMENYATLPSTLTIKFLKKLMKLLNLANRMLFILLIYSKSEIVMKCGTSVSPL